MLMNQMERDLNKGPGSRSHPANPAEGLGLDPSLPATQVAEIYYVSIRARRAVIHRLLPSPPQVSR